jgi:capsular polysaccharide biosynthesis protein
MGSGYAPYSEPPIEPFRMRASIAAIGIAPIRAVARRLNDIQSTTALTLTPMGNFAQVSDREMLLSPGRPAFWEAYPEMTFPKHQGFNKELSHESTAAPIPNWMKIDSGCWTPPVRFARINDAILWLFDGVAMTRSGKLINESAFTLLEKSSDLTAMPGTKRRRQRTVFDQRSLQDVEVIDEPVLVPANGWSRAFGHWIYDTLTAIGTFIEPIRSGRLRVVMPEATPWQRSWLALLGVPENAIIEGGYGYVKARHAIIPSTLSIQNVRYPGPHTVELIDALRSRAQSPGPVSPYLYLSRLGRGEASHRTMVNEAHLVAALERIGYVAVAPEALKPAEQVALFAQARVILGPVGSAFALSGLAAPGASIVEILPPPAAHSWIYRSSANFDHLYGCIMAEVIEDSQRDLDSGGIKRADWFYSYQVDHDAVISIAKHAIELSR